MMLAGIIGVAFALMAAGVSLLALLAVSLGGMSDNCRDSNQGLCSTSTQLADFVMVSSIAFAFALGGTTLAIWLVLGRSRRGVGGLRLIGASAALMLATIAVSLVAAHAKSIPLFIGLGVLALLGWAWISARVFDRRLYGVDLTAT
jgi:hypothetical protein